ncbi:MAG: hypothetical protein QXS20_02510 [Candidatus Thorarchaeota archaeon]
MDRVDLNEEDRLRVEHGYREPLRGFYSGPRISLYPIIAPF